jgi:hypothetical protein
MNWLLLGGVAQCVFIGLFLVNYQRGRSTLRPRDLLVYVVPMLALAIATLAGATWALVAAAVFYLLWLVNSVLAKYNVGPAVRTRRHRPVG